MNKPLIQILMATYNGEKYISNQIESLLEQTYKEWQLLIRDDGSKDDTIKKIKQYVEKYPEKIRLIEDDKGGLRAKNNFLELLKHSTAQYVMFCDQDDVWLPFKIEKTLLKMTEVENGPTLIHTDLKVVGRELNVISESMWKFQNLDPSRKQYNYIITQNNITGCTMMINRELADFVNKGSFPNGIMHDWVIGIIASLKGTIDYINEATILYRQHGNNDVGAQGYFSSFFKKLKQVEKIKKEIYKTNFQLEDILNSITVDKQIKAKLEEYIQLPKKNFLYRKFWILKNDFMKQGVLWKVAYIIMI